MTRGRRGFARTVLARCGSDGLVSQGRLGKPGTGSAGEAWVGPLRFRVAGVEWVGSSGTVSQGRHRGVRFDRIRNGRHGPTWHRESWREHGEAGAVRRGWVGWIVARTRRGSAGEKPLGVGRPGPVWQERGRQGVETLGVVASVKGSAGTARHLKVRSGKNEAGSDRVGALGGVRHRRHGQVALGQSWNDQAGQAAIGSERTWWRRFRQATLGKERVFAAAMGVAGHDSEQHGMAGKAWQDRGCCGGDAARKGSAGAAWNTKERTRKAGMVSRGRDRNR